MFVTANRVSCDLSERSAGGLSGGIWLCEIGRIPSTHDNTQKSCMEEDIEASHLPEEIAWLL